MTQQQIPQEIKRLRRELAKVREENTGYRKIILEMMPEEKYEITEEDLKAFLDRSSVIELINELAPKADKSVAVKKKVRPKKTKVSVNL